MENDFAPHPLRGADFPRSRFPCLSFAHSHKLRQKTQPEIKEGKLSLF